MSEDKPLAEPVEKLFFDVELPSKKDELIGSLQEALDKEVDRRLEERWIWLLSIMLIFDAFAFQQMSTWAGPMMIGVIQIIALVALGRKWQVDHIWTLTEKIIDKWNGTFK
ncbi:hypothetical protein ACVNHC_21395 [Pannonibacter sp. Q-1]